MPLLADVAQGRDNNFNLIRFVAATAVLVSHAWPIGLGIGTQQPLKALTGHTLGGIAVFVFFAASGFFIAASFSRSRSSERFLLARTMRLFPGLVVSLLLVGLVMGPLVSDLAPGAYFTSPETFTFLLRNAALALPQYTLPGVFEANPYPTVEGSIWTLIHEVACYMLIFMAGVTGLLWRRGAMTLVLLAYAVLWILPDIFDLHVPGRLAATRELSLPFVMGTALWIWRDRVVLSLWGIAGLCALAWAGYGTLAGFPLLMAALTYGMFWCAYVPGGAIRSFNRLGDYSYGMYIYAFPLQGLAVWLAGGGAMDPWVNIALALPMTLICAVASWHLVERPALAFAHTARIARPKTARPAPERGPDQDLTQART